MKSYIRMLRVKQEVHRDKRLELSKEQLLTRLIATEQEYRNFKNNHNASNKTLDTDKIKEILKISTTALKNSKEKVQELYDAIQKLWKANYAAIQLYKEILDVAKERHLIKDFHTSQKLVYAIIDRVEHYLENSDFDFTNYENIISESYDFVHNLEGESSSLDNLQQCIFQDLDLYSNTQNISINSSVPQSKSNLNIFEKARSNESQSNNLNDHPDLTHQKSRNLFKGSLSSKNYDDSWYTSNNLIRDQRSMKMLDKKLFLTADSNKRKKARINKMDLQVSEPLSFEDEIELYVTNYKALQNEISTLINRNPNINVNNRIAELVSDSEFTAKIKSNVIEKVESVKIKNRFNEAKIDKLLENLSIMILSKQHIKDIDQESCDFIQKLFGDKALVKILKHIDTSNAKFGESKTKSRKQMQAYKQSLIELRKCMMQIEMNVNSRDNFLIDESEAEATQNLFIKSLSIVDKMIMSIRKVTVSKSISKTKINESSTNKSNSDWETKSVSCDKTMFDIDSRSMINPEFGVHKKTDPELWDKTDLGSFTINQKQTEENSKDINDCQSQEDGVFDIKQKQKQNCLKSELELNHFAGKDDYLSIIHMQAAHLENLVLYIEDLNVDLDKEKL